MKILRKILGVIVMIAGIIGLIFSLVGIFFVWNTKPAIETAMANGLTVINGSLNTSIEVIGVTKDALSATVSSVYALRDTVAAASQSVEETKPFIEGITNLLSTELPDTIAATQSSLESAQSSAKVLDSVLTSMDGVIRLITFSDKSLYNPDTPLYESLGEVASSLNNLPQSFVQMGDSLGATQDNVDTIKTSLDTMAVSIESIAGSLDRYVAMTEQSKSSIANVQTWLKQIQNNLSNILIVAASVITVFLVWLAIAQIVILTQGWELFQGTAGRLE
jgi:methyl-accepting chemotaxis protein